ncbi:hypothetical protein CRYUN_Cryun08bG0089600 [Craigia yunnanensis]
MCPPEDLDRSMRSLGNFCLPPIGEDRVSELGKWAEREIKVSGSSWDMKSIDIAAAGLGWLSLGLKGKATL